MPIPEPTPRKAFDGDTYDVKRDYTRLKGQLGRVYSLMIDGQWRTLEEIATCIGGSEAAVSARLRDFRKKKYGRMIVERKHCGGGLYIYRLIPPTLDSLQQLGQEWEEK